MKERLSKRQTQIHQLVGRKLSTEAIAAELGLTVGTVATQLARIRQRLDNRPLTKREQEVLELIGRGLNDLEISAQFGISARTIEIHRQSIIAKYRARSTSHLLAMLHNQASEALLGRIAELEAMVADLQSQLDAQQEGVAQASNSDSGSR